MQSCRSHQRLAFGSDPPLQTGLAVVGFSVLSCVVVQLLPVHTLRLGVELDSFDGHHYISSVAPGGPVDRHGVLRPEDELLEVKLYPEVQRRRLLVTV